MKLGTQNTPPNHKMWREYSNITDSVVLSQPPATYFINSTSEEKVGDIRGVRNPKFKAFCAKTRPLATYRKQFKQGGNGTNRTFENLESIGALVVDIDWNRSESLDHQGLLDHCDSNGVPRPNNIISTPTPNHYQLFWEFPYIKTDKLGWHKTTAKALYKLFKEFDADPSTTVDPTKITRNPDYLKANTVYHSDHINTLGFIYHALKKIGLIKKNKSKNKYPRRRKQIPFSNSLNAIETFFREQGNYKGTHESIYKILDIPKSTYYLLLSTLKKQKKINIAVIRTGKTWITEFKYFDSLRKEYIDRGAACSRGNGSGFKKNVEKMVQKFNMGCVKNYRNITTFVLSRNLAYLGYTQWQILQKLSQGLDICKQYGRGFDDKEIERTIKSACNPKYQNPFSYWTL